MASKRNLRRRTCERKSAFPTEQRAWLSCDRWNYRETMRMQPYKCQFGDHWHIGHSTAGNKAYLKARRNMA